LFYSGGQTDTQREGRTDRRDEANSPSTQFCEKPLKMPDVIYISKSDATMPGFKAAKDRLTILFRE
jgi:hypothetical protein